ncbi:MAG: acetolactate synthase small subunit [Thermoleophilia bacterium]|nr:acetolactate synthase small subunit [Thermoleophilia bacterium]
MTQHTLSVLVENKPGVLSRVAGLFTRRGYNIDSLAVSPTEHPDRSRMTITVDASRFPVEQITKQLDKLVNVIKIRDLDPENMVARELGLFKVSTTDHNRADILALIEIFRGEIVDVTHDALTIEATGTTADLENLEELLKTNGLVEMVRTGVVALGRGAHTT